MAHKKNIMTSTSPVFCNRPLPSKTYTTANIDAHVWLITVHAVA